MPWTVVEPVPLAVEPPLTACAMEVTDLIVTAPPPSEDVADRC